MTQSFTLVKSDHVFKINPGIIKCPYCGGNLVASVSAWTLQGDGWIAETIEVECQSEPDLDSDEWDDWLEGHSDMPYVYWLPVVNTIEKAINLKYRFDLEK